MATVPSHAAEPLPGGGALRRAVLSDGLSRRSFLGGVLGVGAVAAGGSLLAACGGGGNLGAGGAAASLTSSSASTAAAGEITIWDRSGDLFKVFDGVIASFNKVYPNIKVNHQQVDIDAKLRMSRVPWNFGGGPVSIRPRSRLHHDRWHRQAVRPRVRARRGGRVGAGAR